VEWLVRERVERLLMSPNSREARPACRVADLYLTDTQFADAQPPAAVTAAIERPGLGLPVIVRTVMDGYADRPAVGTRASRLATGPKTGRNSFCSWAAAVGTTALIAAVVFDLAYVDDPGARTVAGGSGDSATGPTYASPTVPAMTVSASDMRMGVTATLTLPATTLATSFASPAVKASPAAECVNNGQCP
jgi:hypothetical protein